MFSGSPGTGRTFLTFRFDNAPGCSGTDAKSDVPVYHGPLSCGLRHGRGSMAWSDARKYVRLLCYQALLDVVFILLQLVHTPGCFSVLSV